MIGPILIFIASPLLGLLLGLRYTSKLGKIQIAVSILTLTILTLFVLDIIVILSILGYPQDPRPVVLAMPFVFAYFKFPTLSCLIFGHGGWVFGTLLRRACVRYVKKQNDT